MKFKIIFLVIFCVISSFFIVSNAMELENKNFNKELKFNKELYRVEAKKNNNNIYQARFKKYDNNTKSWVYIDDGSLNYDINKWCFSTNLIGYNNEIYIFWNEQNSYSIGEIHCKKYNPINNELVPLNNSHLNDDITKFADCPKVIVYNNELYIGWSEESNFVELENSKGKKTIATIKIKKYNKNINKWIPVNTSSLNYSNLKDYNIKDFKLINNDLHIVFEENNMKGKVINKVKKYDLSKDIWIDAIDI